MCNTNDKQCKIPCWTWIIIVIIVVTIIAATIYGISSATSYEKSEKESKSEKTTQKDEDNEEIINVHIEKHRIDRQHERLSQSARLTHELYKVGIIAPCVLGAVVIIGGVLYRIVPQTKPPHTQTSKNRTPKNNENRNHENTDGRRINICKETKISKAKADDLNTLLLMGFNRKEAIKAVLQTSNIGDAINKLHETSITNDNDSESKTKTQDENTDDDQNDLVSIWV